MKKQILFTIYIILIQINNTVGQSVFQKVYGGTSIDFARSLQVTDDGGYIITGTTWSYGVGGDAYLLKTDSAGNVQWMKNYGGNFWDSGNSVQQTDDGGYIVTGSTYLSNGGNDAKVYLLKTDSNGDTLWTKMYGDPAYNYWSTSVVQTNDHGYILAAADDNGVVDGSRLIKTDSSGNLSWSKYYISFASDFHGLCQTSDGGFVLVDPEIYSRIIKTDSTGTLTWAKQFIDFNHAFLVYSVEKTNDNGFIFAGEYRVIGSLFACYLFKTDSSGTILWSKAYSCLKYMRAYSVQQTTDNGYIMTGYITDSSSNYDAFALKTDSAGNVNWMKKYGGADSDQAYSIQQTADGGFIMAGITESYGSGINDIYLIKTDSAGNSGCNDSVLNPAVITPVVAYTTFTGFGPLSLVEGSPPTIIDTVTPQQTVLCNSFVSIPENSLDAEKLFPNPAKDFITIHYNLSSSQQTAISLFNLYGQKLKTIITEKQPAGEHEIKIDLKDVAAGVYLVDVISNGERMVKKIMKE